MILKENPQDFIVNEIPDKSLWCEEATNYHVYCLKKTNYTTQRAITHIAKALHISSKQIRFSGTKDKRAVTTQYITIKGASKERVAQLNLKDLSLSFVGYARDHFSLGDLKGNEFIITVKDVSMSQQVPSHFVVPNYFDDQRFSTHNVDIGVAILKKKYQRAVSIIAEHDDDYAQNITEHLSTHEHDYVGALRLLPTKILLFYVHSVQSYIFNEALARLMQESTTCRTVSYSQGKLYFSQVIQTSSSQQELPLIGFTTPVTNELVDSRDFLNKSFPELSLEGSTRQAFSEVTQCSVKQQEDSVCCTFRLGKGSYATIVLKQLFE